MPELFDFAGHLLGESPEEAAHIRRPTIDCAGRWTTTPGGGAHRDDLETAEYGERTGQTNQGNASALRNES